MVEAPVEAVSFDVTGTLLGLPRLGEEYAAAFRRHGLPADPAALARLVPEVWQEFSIRVRLGEDRFASHPDGAKGFWREFVARVAERAELPVPSPFLAAELYERFALPDAWEVFPDVRPALAALRAAGLRLAVASNFDERLPRLLAGAGLAPSLHAVVFSGGVGAEKPHPAVFRRLVGALGVAAERIVHVGDSKRDDVEGAQAVGLQALWLTRGARRGDLASLAELPALLSPLHARRGGAR